MKQFRIVYEKGQWVVYKFRGIMWFAIGHGIDPVNAWEHAKRRDFEISDWAPARALFR